MNVYHTTLTEYMFHHFDFLSVQEVMYLIREGGGDPFVWHEGKPELGTFRYNSRNGQFEVYCLFYVNDLVINSDYRDIRANLGHPARITTIISTQRIPVEVPPIKVVQNVRRAGKTVLNGKEWVVAVHDAGGCCIPAWYNPTNDITGKALWRYLEASPYFQELHDTGLSWKDLYENYA